MHLTHLSIENFRNYSRLELDLPPGVVVLVGGNAQGKTNLLETIYYLATSKSFRAANDREVVNRLALDQQPAYARLHGHGERRHGPVDLEVAVRIDRAETTNGQAPLTTAKRIRVNQTVKRAIDLIGQITVAVFTPQDLDLVTGAPLLRRRYLDFTISQVDTRYCRTLAHYNKVVLRRNHLLRGIRERQAKPDQLEFWDEELCRAGAEITVKRARTVEEINDLALDYHRRLTGTGERTRVIYRPSLEIDRYLLGIDEVMVEPTPAVFRGYREQLRRIVAREIAQGVSLLGPHRDDLTFLVDEEDVSQYGSRGQQRTVSLSLKLAESSFLLKHTGDQPILLLDDVMSELDAPRRAFVAEVVRNVRQVLITGTDLSAFPREFLADATILEVNNGAVSAFQYAT